MIGILTFQATNNFGAHLHVIALYRKIQELGYDCEVIDYQSPNLIARETSSFRNLGWNPKRRLGYLLWGRKVEQKYKILLKELRTYVKLSPVYTPQNIKEANKRYDTFVIGADVVWSLRITNNDYNFFLDFANEEKNKLAYSSSVGETDLYRDDKRLPDLLNRFSQIAVREQEAVEWVKDIAGKNVDYVCDPTMLLTSLDWDEVLTPKEYKEDYVLVYFFEKEKMYQQVLDYAKEHRLKIKFINSGRNIAGMETVWPKSLAEFVGLIKHAQALFTASYHGMLFGLYYHREQFFYNRGLKARMASLSTKFGLENHNGEMISNINDVPKIDYLEVDKKIGKFRDYSINVLKQMLDGNGK